MDEVKKQFNRAKGATKSRTMYFALALIGFGAIEQALPETQSLISPDMYGILTSGVGLIVAVLRWITTTDLGEK